ncbi:hypothetical protein Dimus_009663 [Dionaea muscipula]
MSVAGEEEEEKEVEDKRGLNGDDILSTARCSTSVHWGYNIRRRLWEKAREVISIRPTRSDRIDDVEDFDLRSRTQIHGDSSSSSQLEIIGDLPGLLHAGQRQDLPELPYAGKRQDLPGLHHVRQREDLPGLPHAGQR